MSNDGPLFDDEELPSWLTSAGITGGGEKNAPQSGSQPSSTDSSTGSSASDDLNWLDDAAFNTPSGASSEAAPWLQDTAPKQGSSLFGAGAGEDTPPWMANDSAPKGPNPFDEPIDDEAPPWMQSSGSSQSGATQQGQAGFGVTGMLPWRQELDGPEADNFSNNQNDNIFGGEPQQTPSIPSQAEDDLADFDWLDELPSEPAAPPTPPAPQTTPTPSTIRPIKPLTPPPSQPPSQPSEPSQPAASSASPTPSVIRRLPSASTPPPPASESPQAPVEQPTIRAIKPLQPRQDQQPITPEPPAPDYSNMTYEEWEQQQLAAEEARNNPESVVDEDLLNSVPDWIAGNESAVQAGAPTEPETIPDWFSGMEEQSTDDAPDWFKSADLSGTPLVGPDSISASFASPEPAPAAPSAEDVPDWFKGTTPGVDDIDFNAMFVSNVPTAPEPERASLSSLLPNQPMEQTPAERPITGQPTEIQPESPQVEPPIVAPAPTTDNLALSDDFDLEPETSEESAFASLEPASTPSADLDFGSIEQANPISAISGTSGGTADTSLDTSTDDDLDWMSEMPDVDDLLSYAPPVSAAQQEVETNFESEPAASVESDDSMDWFGGQEAVIEDEDLAIEDIDLGETVQEPAAELAAENVDPLDWMGESASEGAITDAFSDQANDGNWMDQFSFGDETSTSVEATPGVTASEVEPLSEAPDWMAAMASGLDAPQNETVSRSDQVAGNEPAAIEADLADFELPDWVSSVSTAESTPTGETAIPSDLGSVIDDGTPSWLREAPPAAPTPAAERAEPASSGTGEFDWLTDFSNTPEIAQSESVANATPVDASIDAMPDWFNDMPAAPEFSMEDLPPLAPAESLDFSSLSEPVTPTPTTSSAPISSDTSGENIDIDALLNFSLPPVSTPATSRMQAQTDTQSADFDLDAVLGPADEAQPVEMRSPEAISADALSDSLANIFASEDEDTYEPQQVDSGSPAPQPAVPASPKEILPDWVSDMRPADGPVILRVGHQEMRFQDQPLNKLPDKVRRLRERTKEVGKQRPARAESIASGPLAGVADAIEVVPESIQPRIVIGESTPLIVSDLDARRIKIIQNILGVEEQLLMERALAEEEREEKQAKVNVTSAPIRSKIKIDRFIVTILLALAIAAPFLLRTLSIVEAPTIANMTAAQQKAQQDVGAAINGLQAGKPVVVAFEYGPTASGELDDLARAMLRDVIKHGAQPIIVSSNIAGIIHAQNLMRTVSISPTELQAMGRPDKPLIANQDYVILRYLPSGAIGVRSFTNAVLSGDFKQFSVQALFQNDIAGRPTNLTDVSVVSLRQNPAFIITETPEDVRTWIEQYKSEPPLAPLKLVLLSSASASAVSQAYASSAADRVVGPLVGLRDALIYQEQHQPLTAPAQAIALQRWNSVGLATLLAALIILFGAGINVIRNLQRRITG